ncbi:MAG: CPBP family intramembrane metalloprotease [Caldilineaceae bacterium]|nr:CPBP family intramembrane metalloprotease [Caldilineaceae bacterium]
MSERRNILWFLAITVVISWPLFLLPLAFGDADAATRQTVALVGWSLAMFAPAIAALLTVRLIAGERLSSLNLRRLGPKRYYLWAWLLPPLLAMVALLSTLLLGFGQLDPTFALIRSAIPAGAEGAIAPVGVVVAGQIIAAFTIAPLINIIPAMGEELGWRGFLLPRLMHLGKWRAIGLSNVIWGIWHAPAILQGHNYPENPVLGVFLMVGFCLLIGAIFSWLYLQTESAWAPALAHGSLNATAGLPILFLAPGVNVTLGGTLASVAGWIGLAIFVAWLVATRRL